MVIYSLSNFRSYQLSLEFHRRCREYSLPGYLKNQLLRAAISVSLNLADQLGGAIYRLCSNNRLSRISSLSKLWHRKRNTIKHLSQINGFKNIPHN